MSPVKSFIVRYDPNTEAPYRNKEGWCEVCKAGQLPIHIYFLNVYIMKGVPSLRTFLNIFICPPFICSTQFKSFVYLITPFYVRYLNPFPYQVRKLTGQKLDAPEYWIKRAWKDVNKLNKGPTAKRVSYNNHSFCPSVCLSKVLILVKTIAP